MAKHRNGGLDEIRLKFVGHLGRFENKDTFDYATEIHSSMNDAANDDTFKNDHFGSADEAFGSSLNDPSDDVPF